MLAASDIPGTLGGFPHPPAKELPRASSPPLHASIIIASRNKLGTLSEVLRNLQGQSFPLDGFEVVVIDDESTDGTRPHLRALRDGGALPRLVLEEVDHTDVCPARVRNRGLAVARGEIVIFLDADVLVGPDFVAEHVAAHRAGETALVGYVYAYPLAASERTPEKIKAPPIGEVIERLPALLREDPKHWRDGRETHYRIWPDMATCPMPWLFFWGGNSSVPRRLVMEVGGFDDGFKNWGFEDVELGYRLWRRGVPFTLRRQAWGFHYPHPTGTDDRRFLNLLQFLSKHPEPYVELNTFASTSFREPGAARVRWEILDRLGAPRPVADPPSAAQAAALVAFARGGGPVAWLGEWPDGATTPELVSRPFRPTASPGRAALIGLALPFAEPTFSSVLLVDYWQAMSPAVRRFLTAEATRVAGAALFVSTTAASEDALADTTGYTVERAEVAGTAIQIVRRSGP